MIYLCVSWRTIPTGSTYLGSTIKYQDSRADFSSTTEDGFGPRSSQYKFIDQALKSAPSRLDVKWIIIFFHQPMYTSPSHHTPLSSLASISIEAKNLLAN